MPRPSRPPLFPYTTLFRSTLGGFKGVGEGGTIGAPAAVANAIADALQPFGMELSELPATPDRLFRSEEHTSELQSADHLVCRLLLEKKNKKKQDKTRYNIT